MAQTPIERATVRQARDGDRPTEDDIAKAKLGPQGVLGSTAPPIFQRRYASAALILQHRLRQILLAPRSMNSTAAHNRWISNGVQGVPARHGQTCSAPWLGVRTHSGHRRDDQLSLKTGADLR